MKHGRGTGGRLRTRVEALGRRIDPGMLLVVYVLLLIGVPSRLVVSQVGASGTPANLLGLVLLLWWTSDRLASVPSGEWGGPPVRRGLALLVLACLASYATGMIVGFSSPFGVHQATDILPDLIPPTTAEVHDVIVSAADRGLISLAAWCGVLVIACDALRERRRLEAVVRTLVLATTVMALLGMLQFFTGFDLASHLQIPGLRANAELGLEVQRSVFRRVSATAIHPIEFGVVLGAVLPLALHRALNASGPRARWSWLPVVVIAFALPMSVSRSGVLAAAAAGLVLFLGWGRSRRLWALVITPVFLVVIRLLVPGILGTIRNLFLNVLSDPSTTGRTDDYPVAARMITDSPVFGHGLFTFVPGLYRTFDNQWLLAVVELGVVGAIALLVLLVAGVVTALAARRVALDETVRHLGLSLGAAVTALTTSYLTFDALSFPMAASLTFLTLGLCGATWRVARAELPDDISRVDGSFGRHAVSSVGASRPVPSR